MSKFGRYSITEIPITRIMFALQTRIAEIPHSLAWIFKSRAQENKNRITQFHNIHSGKRCFIVANGPSLAKINLDLLKEEYTFGLNRVYLNFSKSSFRPTYYIAVNELVLEQFSHDIALLEMPKFINWNRRSFYDENDMSIYYIKSKMVVKDVFKSDLTQPIVFGGTVSFVALQIAYYMGFEKVILIGLDHSYVDKGTPSKTVVQTNNQDQSHFHPDYFPKGYKWQLPDLLRSEIDYVLALKNYQEDHRQILDATIGGKCPVFPKIDYFSLFN